jgi:DNA polymerase V
VPEKMMKAIVDCNSFYAACERVFAPALHGKPVVVLSNNDGCIVSRSDEAKMLGVGMAAPYYQNKDIIERNNVAVFSSNYHLYGDMSWRVMETLRMLAPDVEVYSVDEAFLNLDGIDESLLHEYGLMLKKTTEQWTGIPVSVGIAPTKVLSKVANRLAKKNKQATGGVMALPTPAHQREALECTPVEDIWGVGRESAKKLKLFNILNGWQLRNMSEEWAKKNLGGIVGTRLIKELNGEPCIEMKNPLEAKKMIATTRMFGKPVFELKQLKEAVATYTTRAAEKLRRQHAAAKVINVFVVTNDYGNDYNYNPRSKGTYTTLPVATSITQELISHALPLVEQLYKKGSRYLKAGVMLSGIVPDDAVQYNLFEPPVPGNMRQLMSMIDNVNFSMRDDVVKFAAAGTTKNWKMRQEMRSDRCSTRWEEIKTVS